MESTIIVSYGGDEAWKKVAAALNIEEPRIHWCRITFDFYNRKPVMIELERAADGRTTAERAEEAKKTYHAKRISDD